MVCKLPEKSHHLHLCWWHSIGNAADLVWRTTRLSALLFVLFLSDLPSVVSGLSALFADDTLAYDRCDGSPSDKSSSCCRLQHDLTSIHQWSNEWATTFNPAKSAVVDFWGKRKKHGDCSASPSFGTMSVPVCEKVKHLGIQLTSTLSWTPHVDSLLHRVTHKVFILRRLAYRCKDNNFVCSLYLALVRPVLEYAGPVWDSCKKADSLRLERVQLSIARSILRADRRSTGNISVLESIGQHYHGGGVGLNCYFCGSS